jgi:plastocyanin
MIMTIGSPAAGQQDVRGTVHVEGRAIQRAVVQLIPEGVNPGRTNSDSAIVDQLHLRFLPDVLPVQVGTTVHFRNSDPVMHNVFSPQRRGADFDLGTYPTQMSRSFRFDEPGDYVVLCHIHPEMAAWVIVVESPHFALTDEQGEFRIEEVPAGRYTLRTWARRREIPDQSIVVVPEEGEVVTSVMVDDGVRASEGSVPEPHGARNGAGDPMGGAPQRY